MAAVADADKGKPSALFSRTSSHRSILADVPLFPPGGTQAAQAPSAAPRPFAVSEGGADGSSLQPALHATGQSLEDQRALNEQLSRRLAALEVGRGGGGTCVHAREGLHACTVLAGAHACVCLRAYTRVLMARCVLQGENIRLRQRNQYLEQLCGSGGGMHSSNSYQGGQIGSEAYYAMGQGSSMPGASAVGSSMPGGSPNISAPGTGRTSPSPGTGPGTGGIMSPRDYSGQQQLPLWDATTEATFGHQARH